jgi:hypothetical protein
MRVGLVLDSEPQIVFAPSQTADGKLLNLGVVSREGIENLEAALANSLTACRLWHNCRMVNHLHR